MNRDTQWKNISEKQAVRTKENVSSCRKSRPEGGRQVFRAVVVDKMEGSPQKKEGVVNKTKS